MLILIGHDCGCFPNPGRQLCVQEERELATVGSRYLKASTISRCVLSIVISGGVCVSGARMIVFCRLMVSLNSLQAWDR